MGPEECTNERDLDLKFELYRLYIQSQTTFIAPISNYFSDLHLRCKTKEYSHRHLLINNF